MPILGVMIFSFFVGAVAFIIGMNAGHFINAPAGDNLLRCNVCGSRLSVLRVTHIDSDGDPVTPEGAEYLCRHCGRYYTRREVPEGVEGKPGPLEFDEV